MDDDTTLHVSVRLEDDTTVTHFYAPSPPAPGDTIEVNPLYGKPRVRYVVTEHRRWSVVKRDPAAPIGADRLQDVVVTVERVRE